jgi:hypothetical protein
MDLYTTSLLLGGVGLGVMAVSGIGRHGGGSHGHAGHGHAGHAGHGHAGHGHAHSHSHAVHTHSARDTVWALMSPRILFSFLIGFGTTGTVLHGPLGGVLLFAAAAAGGVAFERLIVAPLWNFAMRFASKPALTLESVVTEDATAVSNFDANGQGLVAVELDGQLIQILGTLQATDRALGVRVRAGERVRIEDVDPATNCCTVSVR